MVSDLRNCCKTSSQKQRILFFEYLLDKSFEHFLENRLQRFRHLQRFHRFNVFIISKHHSSLSNKFYDRN